jgi:DNA polymerase (family X)
VLYPHAEGEALRLVAAVRAHPEVTRAEIAGSVRRHLEVVSDVDVVAACRSEPAAVAASFGRMPGVKDVVGAGGESVRIRFVDGTRLDLHCVRPSRFGSALFRATGSDEHVAEVRARLESRHCRLDGDALRDSAGAELPVEEEKTLYQHAGLAWVPPELREGRGEVGAAARGALPRLLEPEDVRGVLHCHSDYSDGTATIEQMARAAMARGWRYFGVSDHSQAAFYAGGVSPERIVEQHDEIDRVNASLQSEGFRVLKGIEADILADGRIDYDEQTLARFDYVIGSIHSRFNMDGRAMTDRVLGALDDPHLTILGHPTGRLLLTREPYAIDMQPVLEKAAALGVAVELNADPHRLDLDWRLLQEAKRLGAQVEIGPDAHSPHGLDNMALGVGIARKGWLEKGDVLNAREVEGVLEFARRRRG